MHHADQRRAALDEGRDHREVGHLVDIHRVRAERPERRAYCWRVVAGAEREAGRESRLPGRDVLARAGTMHQPQRVAAPAQFTARDVGVRLRAGECAKAFVDVE